MNAFAIFAVNAHLESLLDEAAERRVRETRKPSRPSRRSRIAAFLASFDRSIGRAASGLTGLVPLLTESPSRY